MKILFGIVVLAVMANCGRELSADLRAVRGVRLVDDFLREVGYRWRGYHPDHLPEVLGWLKNHPKIKTIGIESNQFADEFGISHTRWGKLVNGHPELSTVSLTVDGKPLKFIFHHEHTPESQVLEAIIGFSDKKLQQGILIEEIAEKVHYGERITRHGLYASIGRYVDKDKFIVRRVGGSKETRVQFRVPADGLSDYELEILELIKGHPQIKTTGIRSDIFGTDSKHLRKLLKNDPELALVKMSNNGRKMQLFFHQGFTPRKQLNRILDDLPEQKLLQGVLAGELATKVSFGKYLDKRGLNTQLGIFVDKDRFSVFSMLMNGKRTQLVFRKGFTPKEQVAKALEGFSERQLKHGVSIEEIAEKVHYGKHLTDRGLHISIGRHLDKEKFVVSLTGEGRNKTIVRLRGDNFLFQGALPPVPPS